MKIHLPLCLCFLLFSGTYRSQESAPSLVIGLNGVIGSKGTIDVEVLSGLISDKQDELRKETISYLLKKNYRNGSFTFYSFLSQSLSNLFESKNITSTKRKLMENLTNLAMVYGFSEFYMRTSFEMMHNPELRAVFNSSSARMLDPNLRQWWLERLVTGTPNSLSGLSVGAIRALCNPGSAISYSTLVMNTYRDIIPNLKNLKTDLNAKFAAETRVLTLSQKNFNSLSSFMINKIKPYTDDENNISLNDILLDMIYDIMLNNRDLEKLGFFKISRESPDENYLQMNKYLFMLNDYNDPEIEDLTDLSGTNLTLFRNEIRNLHDKIAKETSLLVKNFLLVKELMNKEMSIDQLARHYSSRMGSISNKTAFNLATDGLVRKIFARIDILENDTLLKKTNDVLKFMKDLINRNENNFTDDDITKFKDMAYWTKLQLQSKGLLDAEDDQITDKIYAFVWYKRLSNLAGAISLSNFSNLSQISLTTFSDFMQLLTNLGSLDKAGTYEEVFKLVMNAGYLFDDVSNTAVFNTLVGNIEKYATIDLENNKLDIDVETVILALYEKWNKKAASNFSFYFSIGLNQSFGGVSLQDDKTPEKERYNPKNLSFASEKIGIRWKVYNHEKRIAKLPETQRKRELTMLSNYNVTLYGSGLLYNITNTLTNEGFKYPILGLSTGLQFFNGLEVNLFYCSPIYGNREPLTLLQKNYMIGLAFDVPIPDYIKAVRKKREEERAQKAKDNQTNTEK